MKNILKSLEKVEADSADDQIKFLIDLHKELTEYANKNEEYFSPRGGNLITNIVLKLRKLEELRHL